jgi:hypothetical protein
MGVQVRINEIKLCLLGGIKDVRDDLKEEKGDIKVLMEKLNIHGR